MIRSQEEGKRRIIRFHERHQLKMVLTRCT
jgi:hypothetical protein